MNKFRAGLLQVPADIDLQGLHRTLSTGGLEFVLFSLLIHALSGESETDTSDPDGVKGGKMKGGEYSMANAEAKDNCICKLHGPAVRLSSHR